MQSQFVDCFLLSITMYIVHLSHFLQTDELDVALYPCMPHEPTLLIDSILYYTIVDRYFYFYKAKFMLLKCKVFYVHFFHLVCQSFH